MNEQAKKVIRKVALWSLATYGACSLLAKLPDKLCRLDPTYRDNAGTLENGINYRITNGDRFTEADPYHISFGDGITVDDALRDGVLYCYDINDHKGHRILSPISFANGRSPCVEGTYIIDDAKRTEVLNRVQQVYDREKINVKVKDGEKDFPVK